MEILRLMLVESWFTVSQTVEFAVKIPCVFAWARIVPGPVQEKNGVRSAL